ncbi:hypothetical protein NW752_001119 [Fusarium irregulare]|nr:hypothetical protein NW752_001119 [Fusarium irregulare]
MRTPQNVYQENYHAIRKRLDDELRQLMQCQDNPSSYERGADALFQLAGEIKELEIQYRQSVTSMEQDYRERLDVAHKRLACGMIDAFGDIIFDPCVQDKFRQALAHQKLAIETDSIREEHNIAQDTHTDPQTDTDLDEHERVMTHMALDEHASLESQSTGGGARGRRDIWFMPDLKHTGEPRSAGDCNIGNERSSTGGAELACKVDDGEESGFTDDFSLENKSCSRGEYLFGDEYVIGGQRGLRDVTLRTAPYHALRYPLT